MFNLISIMYSNVSIASGCFKIVKLYNISNKIFRVKKLKSLCYIVGYRNKKFRF